MHMTSLDSLDPLFQSKWTIDADVEERARFVRGDLRNHELFQATIQGQDIIFNCAGKRLALCRRDNRCWMPN